MPYFFDNISDLKTYAGGGANQSLELESMEPAFYATKKVHLLPWMGSAFWDEMKEAYDDDNLSAEQTELLPYLRRALAQLALYEHSRISSVQHSEMGMIRMEGDNQKSAFKYQENEYRRFFLDTGYEAMEDMIIFLEENKADYPTWATGSGRTRHMSVFLNTATLLRELYAKHLSRYTFEVLRPVIQDLENFAIIPLLGQALYDELVTAYQADALSTEQTELITRIRRALAPLSVQEGIRRSWVRLEGNIVISEETLEPQGYTRKGAPTGTQISQSLQVLDEWGNRLLSYIKAYLEEKIDDFPLYQDYLDEQAEAEAEEESPTSTWPERCGCGNQWCGGCTNTDDDITGIIAL